MSQDKKHNHSQKSSDQENFEVLSLGEDKSQSIDHESISVEEQQKHRMIEDKCGRKSANKRSNRSSELEQIKENIQLQSTNQKTLLKIEELQKQNQRLQENFNKAIQECKKVQQQLGISEKKLMLMQKQYEGAKQVINKMSETIISLQQKITNLEEKQSGQYSLNQLENQIEGLRTKIQYFVSQQNQIRRKIQQILNVKPKQKQSLSTLIESVLIDLTCNLKEVGRQIDQLLEIFLMKGYTYKSNKPQKECAKSINQAYNHWIQMSKIQRLKEFLFDISEKEQN